MKTKSRKRSSFSHFFAQRLEKKPTQENNYFLSNSNIDATLMIFWSHLYIIKLIWLSLQNLVYDNTARYDHIVILFLLYDFFQVCEPAVLSILEKGITKILGLTKIYVKIWLLLKNGYVISYWFLGQNADPNKAVLDGHVISICSDASLESHNCAKYLYWKI